MVDDHPGARTFAARSARAAGYLVSEAASGEEALIALRDAAARGEAFDLCLIDQNMPRMDGWRLASEITGDTAINGVRLVLMVPEGTMGGDTKMKLLRWFNAYVSKPLRPAILLETLGKAVSSDVDLEGAEAAGGGKPRGEERPETFPCRLLLAEDHEVNRELFTLLLSRLGCSVSTAQDGQEAVEMATEAMRQGHSFDIVLMDIFMPRMNGYEASGALRRNGYLGPIIAVTASALKGEREKCISVGMSDVLIKPFEKNDLRRILRAWLPGAAGEAKAGTAPASLAEEDGAVTDLEPIEELPGPGEERPASAPADPAVFDWEGVLDTFLGQEETVVRLLERFSAKARCQLGELDAALATENLDGFREVAHSIKGAAWNLSARNLGDAALAAETAGRNKDGAAARVAREALGKALDAFDGAIAPHLAPAPR